MENKEKLFIESVNSYLEKAEFNKKNISEDEANLNINQKIEVLSCNEKDIKIRMSRNVYLSDEDKPIVYVSAIAIYVLSDNSFKNFSDLEEMREYVENKAGYLVDKIQMGSELSKIIANMTGTFGNPPLILPPVLNKETHK